MKKSIGAKTILYPLPVIVVGTYDANGKPNVMTASWAGICCSDPPAVSVSLRKVTYTYENLVRKKAFTVSVPSESQVEAVDYFGIASGKSADKFSVTGLTPAASEVVDAPYVQEFPLILECKLLHTNIIGLHTQFIGEILDVKADAEVISERGMPEIGAVKPIIFSPASQEYFAVGPLLGKAFDLGKRYLNR